MHTIKHAFLKFLWTIGTKNDVTNLSLLSRSLCNQKECQPIWSCRKNRFVRRITIMTVPEVCKTGKKNMQTYHIPTFLETWIHSKATIWYFVHEIRLLRVPSWLTLRTPPPEVHSVLQTETDTGPFHDSDV